MEKRNRNIPEWLKMYDISTKVPRKATRKATRKVTLDATLDATPKATLDATLDATSKATLDATQSDAIFFAEPLPEIAFEGGLPLLSEDNLSSRACSARSNDDSGRCGSGVSIDPREIEEIVHSFLRTASSVDGDASVSRLSSADSGPARADSGPVRALTLPDFY
jgi:hypothetical protein